MDWTVWVTWGLSGTAILLLTLLLLGVRMGFRALASLPQLFTGLLWEDDPEHPVKDAAGNSHPGKRPAAHVVAAVDALTPLLVNRALSWASKNIKLPVSGPPGGPLSVNLAGANPDMILQLLKKNKDTRELANNPLFGMFLPQLLQFGQSFLGKLGGARGAPIETTGVVVGGSTENPFLSQLMGK